MYCRLMTTPLKTRILVADDHPIAAQDDDVSGIERGDGGRGRRVGMGGRAGEGKEGGERR